MNLALPRSSSKISVAELQRLMRDPEFPDEHLKQFFTAYPDASRPFSPAIVPNPERVDVTAPADELEGAVIMDWANSLSRQRRQIQFNWRRETGDQSPVLVSEGDSWFQFPLLLEDVVDQLSDGFNIWSVAAAGDTLKNMVIDQPEYLSALRDQAESVKAFLFSGGGNDFLGEDETGRPVLTQILKRFERGKPAEWYIENDAFVEKLRFAEDCYRKVITSVAKEYPNLPVICHGYDYAIPGGAPGDPRHPIYAAQDQWIGGPMRSIGIADPGLQKSIVRLLIDKFNERIDMLCGGGGGGAYKNAWYVNARGTLGSIGQWADELHPTDDGFALVAAKFRKVIATAAPGIRPEPEAVGVEIAGSTEAAAVRPVGYVEKLVAVTEGEWDRFHEVSETDEPLRSRINQYCREIGISEPENISDFPWSATFVSWCVKTAGATASEFRFDPAHAVFVKAAIANADASTGVFRARPIESYRPKVGDIIHRNRSGGTITYDHARRSSDYPSHSAIVVEVGATGAKKYARTIGGNEGDSIRSTKVALTPDGFVAQRRQNPFICVIEDLKRDVAPVPEALFAVGTAAETMERFVCEASGELENELESTASKPRVDRVEATDHMSSRNGATIDHIVIHYTTSRNIEGSISHFKNGTPRTSAHYIVGRDGMLVQIVPGAERAWHAGNSEMNARSIGIEHVAALGDAIAPAQARTSLALIRWLTQEYGIPFVNVIPHVCVKSTSCCGDLFKDFGGGAGKPCGVQKTALQKWLLVNGIGRTGPESTPFEQLESGPEDRRLAMAKLIVDYEAERDSAGRLKVHKLPPDDGGGRYEVAGINEKFHKAECDELVRLIEGGKHAEAEQRAREFFAGFTDRAADWCRNGATEFFLRDCVFNRGPGGAARILQRAVGVEVDGTVGAETRAALAAAESDIDSLLIALRQAREWYERTYAHRDESSRFWKGLVNRWNKAIADAQKFRDPAPPSLAIAPAAASPDPALARVFIATERTLVRGGATPSDFEKSSIGSSIVAAPQDSFAFDEKQALDASSRWRSRAPARESNQHQLSQKKFDAVEPKERLAKRVNRLLSQGVELKAGGAESALAEDVQGLPEAEVSAEDINNALFERVLGLTRDFLNIEYLDQGRAAARAVARIVTKLGVGSLAYGTGFMVSPSLLLTNNHVLGSPEDAASSEAEFDYARDASRQNLTVHRFRLRPERFFYTSPELDFSLVAVAETSELGKAVLDYGRLPLIADEGKITIGEPVNIVQHPKGELKQVVVRQSQLCDMPQPVPGKTLDLYAYYDSDTEPGSSGSPVFNDQWEVIALHHSGVPRTNQQGEFLDKDGNVWRDGDPTRLDWVANEGIRISRLMGHLGKVIEEFAPDDPKRRYLQELMGSPVKGESIASAQTQYKSEKRPLTVAQRMEFGRQVETSTPIRVSSGAATIVVPLTISVSLGEAERQDGSQTSVSPPKGGGGLVIEENFAPDPDYENRPGYQSDFLGFELPLPKVDNSAAKNVAKLDDGGSELKYNHYSVIMNSARRLAFVSAVNVDVDARAQIGREGADRWSFDPRLPRSIQTGPEVYKNNPLDKGHLTRRQDGAWGATQDEAQKGNDDTFHWTNCSPQHETFNQSQKASAQGLLLWGNLENHVTEQAKLNARRICVFNGPVFRTDDQTYRDVQLPRQFWKIIVMKGDDGNPNAVGFLLSQAELIENLQQENFDPGEFQPFQVKITEIERLSRLDFGDLYKADPLNLDGAERFFERGAAAVHIAEPQDIVLHSRV